MGMFDSVWVPCPRCGKRHEAQSKGGECELMQYELSNAPIEVLLDVNRHAPFTCDCGEKFQVRVQTTVTAQSVPLIKEPPE